MSLLSCLSIRLSHHDAPRTKLSFGVQQRGFGLSLAQVSRANEVLEESEYTRRFVFSSLTCLQPILTGLRSIATGYTASRVHHDV